MNTEENSVWRSHFHYAVYEHRLVAEQAMVYARSFIVIKNQYGVIIRFTNLHKFVGVYENQVFRPITSDAREKMLYVCSMLNYIIIENYEKYGMDHVFEITKSAVSDFFRDFAVQKMTDGRYRGSQSVEKCISSVTLFLRKLCWKYGGYMKLKKDELYTDRMVFTRNGKIQKSKKPDFQVAVIPKESSIFRDIPTKIFEKLVNLAFCYSPGIAFGICIQAFAGLRPGEVCNVRQEGSHQGSGLIITTVDDVVKQIEIDISREYAMRSDGVICGKIKKERKQRVYPPFLSAFGRAYEWHKQYLNGKKYEAEYAPMLVNSKGLAMTYEDYCGKFKKLVEEYLRPELLVSEDAECRIYGQLLYEHSLSPHALRHWYSVQLVLNGEDIAQIQYWRGDTSPQSAFDYLQNKGDLTKELETVNNQLSIFMLEEGKKMYGE